MSVDYYLLCSKCNNGIDIASDGLSGFKFYSGEPDCMEKTKAFLETHVLCGGVIKIVPEHYNDYDFCRIEWKATGFNKTGNQNHE